MAISKTRMRMEQIKGGKLNLKHADASALEIVATPLGQSEELYIKADTSAGQEKVVLGEGAAVKLQLDGDILNGSAIVYTAEGIGANNVDTKLPTAAAVKAYVDASAANVTIADNESANEENAIIFSADADTDGGVIPLEQDHSGLTYNPSAGRITATAFSDGTATMTAGALSGVTTVGCGAITSSGNLAVTGTITGDTSLTLDAVTISTAEIELLDGVTAGTVIASRVASADGNKDMSGGRNLTISGELDAGSGDFSGDIDVDGTANLDAVDIDGAVQADGLITVGADTDGYDIKFFGNGAGRHMLWDESADTLRLVGAGTKLAFFDGSDVSGGEHISAVDNTLTISAGTNITHNSSNHTFRSIAANAAATMTLKSDHAGSPQPHCVLDRNRNGTAMATGDDVGLISFKGNTTTGGNNVFYGQIAAKAEDATDASAEGSLDFFVLANRVAVSGAKLTGNGAGRIDATIGAGAASLVTLPGSLSITAQAAALSMNSQKITNLAAPTSDNDAVRKIYVDNLLQGLDTKDSVIAASTANEGFSYSPAAGTGSVGTLTKGATGPISIDGQALKLADRVLLKDQTQARQNGIWKVTQEGVADAAARFELGFDAGIPANNQTLILTFKGLVSPQTITFRGGTDASDSAFSSNVADIGTNGLSAAAVATAVRTLFNSLANYSSGGSGGVAQAIGNTVADASFNITRDAAGDTMTGPSAIIVNAVSAAPLIITRAEDADGGSGPRSKLTPGAFTFVERGTVNADQGFVMTGDKDIPYQVAVDADGPVWTQFSGAGQITAGLALTKSGNTMNVAVDDSSIEINSDALRVKATGITNAMLAGSIANAKLANSTISGKELGVNLDSLSVDDSSIEFSAGAAFNGSAASTIQVKASGITNAMLGGSIGQDKLAGSIPDSKLNAISSANKVEASALELSANTAMEDNAGLALKANIAGDGLAIASSGGNQVLSVGVDDSSIQLNSDALRVKALGVTDAMLAGSISDSKLSTIAAGNKVSGSAVQLATDSAIADATGLQLKASIAGNGVDLVSSGGNQVLSLTAAGILPAQLNCIEAYHIAASDLASPYDLVQATIAFAPSAASPVRDIANLMSSVSGANTQALNKGGSVKVYLNGQLLTPDLSASSNQDSAIVLASADYKWWSDSGTLKLRFNGALVENGDIIRISGMAIS